jgi:hypothetical protein
MSADGVSEIIYSLDKITKNRAEIVRLTNQLISPDMDMHADHVSKIISSLAKITKNRAEIVELTKQLIRPGMNGYNILEIISLLARTEKRAEIVELTKQLIRPDTSAFGVLGIVGALRMAPTPANSIARALLFMRTGNRNVWQQILETPLNQDVILGGMNAVAQGANPYAAGINAHAKGRDLRTIKAAQTLQENWHPEPEDIDREFNTFWHAVQQLDSLKKSLVLRSLGIDENGVIQPKPATENFSGLLEGSDGEGNFTLSTSGKSMRINGRELIARFWHFANTYEESHGPLSGTHVQVERDAMRAGIMNALAEGVILKRNILRCEMGRVQLLEWATLQGRLKDSEGSVVDIDDLGLNPEKTAVVEVIGDPVAAPAAPQAVQRVRNLNDIAQYLQPFIDSLGPDIKTAEQFYMRLFNYRNNLAAGHVMARGERIDLDPSEVVYFVRMMEPILSSHGKIMRYDINPAHSIVTQLGFDDFQVNDYMRQFGARDQAQLAEARRIEGERVLIAQQNKEHEEGLLKDREIKSVKTIQRIARGSLARKNVQAMRTQAQEKAGAQVELDQRVTVLRAAIVDKTAGTIAADADVLNSLSDAERRSYTRLRNAHLFEQKK